MKNKKMLLLLLPLLLSGCELEENNYDNNNIQPTTTVHHGKCLEYTTEYKLDCGFFVDPDSFCKERKYDKCIRWEDDENDN